MFTKVRLDLTPFLHSISRTSWISTRIKIRFPWTYFLNLVSSQQKTAVIQNLETVLSRHSLLTISEAFIRPYSDFSDVLYDKIFHESWHKKLELAQYSTVLVMIGVIRGNNTEKTYQELGLDYLQNRRKLKSSNFRSRYPEVFLGKGVLKIGCKFSGEHPYRSVISMKLKLGVLL